MYGRGAADKRHGQGHLGGRQGARALRRKTFAHAHALFPLSRPLAFFLGAPQGTIGKLLSVDKKKGKVVVEGVNIKTKHIKPMKEGESGSIVKKENPIHISNVVMADEQPAPAEAAPPAAE